MQKIHEKLLAGSAPVWQRLVDHEFLRRTADGTIPDDTFKIWMKQDYLFVREAIPFIAVLLAKAPLHLRTPLIGVLIALDKELEMFRKNAAAHGVDLTDIEAAPTCLAYLQFLMTVGYNRSFTEGFTVLYAAEKAYLDSWVQVKEGLRGESPWREFIDNWAGDSFKKYVAWLAETLDELTAAAPEHEIESLGELFNQVARYEFLFWEMALTEQSWPV